MALWIWCVLEVFGVVAQSTKHEISCVLPYVFHVRSFETSQVQAICEEQYLSDIRLHSQW